MTDPRPRHQPFLKDAKFQPGERVRLKPELRRHPRDERMGVIAWHKADASKDTPHYAVFWSGRTSEDYVNQDFLEKVDD